jgi:ferric-dicitrate binding protein FerR (iron transport regulator)
MMRERLQQLLDIYHSGDLTEDQRRELVSLLDNEEAAEQFAIFVQERFPEEAFSIEGDLPRTEDRIVQGVLRRIQATPVRRISFLRRWGWAAAAILLIGAGVLFEMMRGSVRPAVVSGGAGAGQDIAPGGNKAVLTLSDGTTITLDSTVSGAIAQQGNTSIVKQADGRIVYNAQGAGAGEVMMNTMRTPRGGQYRLTLPDGTQVWLNAASSITYPAAFTGRQRNVKVSGEAYFEVTKDNERPFVVDVEGGAPVEVLGTHFNINGYTDEGGVKTTLLEGIVRIDRVILKPGQQAQMGRQGLAVMNNVNIDKVMAWKNGLFNFEDVGLKEVMRQLERWYDIEVVYEKDVPDIRFEGEISRNINLSNLLKVLARAEVKFRIEDGRRLVVLP